MSYYVITEELKINHKTISFSLADKMPTKYEPYGDFASHYIDFASIFNGFPRPEQIPQHGSHLAALDESLPQLRRLPDLFVDQS